MLQHVRREYRDWIKDKLNPSFTIEGDVITLDIPDSQDTEAGDWKIEPLDLPEVRIKILLLLYISAKTEWLFFDLAVVILVAVLSDNQDVYQFKVGIGMLEVNYADIIIQLMISGSLFVQVCVQHFTNICLVTIHHIIHVDTL